MYLNYGLEGFTLFNLSFDDFIPSFKSFHLLDRIVKTFPKIKINLFLSTDSKITPRDNSILGLDNQEWVKNVKALSKRNYEIGLHGMYHTVDDMPEFKNLNYSQAKRRIVDSMIMMNMADIDFVKGFRPPMWEMNSLVFKVLDDLNFVFVSDALSYHYNYGEGKIARFYSNIDIYAGLSMYTHPYANVLPDVEKVFFCRGHLVSKCTNNLNTSTFDNICAFLYGIRNNVKFTFLSEYATNQKNKYA